jgi:N-carbamoylputrescine amidase
MMPVIASNRVGTETFANSSITFYGTSFIAGGTGEILAEAPRDAEAFAVATVDLEALEQARRAFGLFRDRRPDLYGPLLSYDGMSN